MRTALLWAITQPAVVISFGFLTAEDMTDMFSHNVGMKWPLLAPKEKERKKKKPNNNRRAHFLVCGSLPLHSWPAERQLGLTWYSPVPPSRREGNGTRHCKAYQLFHIPAGLTFTISTFCPHSTIISFVRNKSLNTIQANRRVTGL